MMRLRSLPWLVLTCGFLFILLFAPMIAQAQGGDPPADGYYYTVRLGDTWTVSRRAPA